jgi:hypothetical protein
MLKLYFSLFELNIRWKIVHRFPKRAYGKREKRKRLPVLEQIAGLPEAADEQNKLVRIFDADVR